MYAETNAIRASCNATVVTIAHILSMRDRVSYFASLTPCQFVGVSSAPELRQLEQKHRDLLLC